MGDRSETRRRRKIRAGLFLALPLAAFFAEGAIAAGGSADSKEAAELVGKPAQEWAVEQWIHSPPLAISSLRGKVILVRWWTAPHCSFCAASAPALNEFDHLYRGKGLVVIGFYHHKSPEPLDPIQVESFARQFGFQFPVAIDPNWQTLNRWWLNGRERVWTSVSFLIDRQGIIRYIHPGGSYVRGDPDYAALKARIEELISQSTR